MIPPSTLIFRDYEELSLLEFLRFFLFFPACFHFLVIAVLLRIMIIVFGLLLDDLEILYFQEEAVLEEGLVIHQDKFDLYCVPIL